MALTHLKSTPVRTVGELPAVGSAAPFCSAEGIDAVTPASVFRSDFGTVYGVELAEGPMAGLLARAVVALTPLRSVVVGIPIPHLLLSAIG